MNTPALLVAAFLLLRAGPAAADDSSDSFRNAVEEGLKGLKAPVVSKQKVSPGRSAAIVEERHRLFMLAALAYAYTRRTLRPVPGHAIAAVVAWDVDDIGQTPSFVIDRNRNFEKQGAVYHAEQMTIRSAYDYVRSKLASLVGRPDPTTLDRTSLYSTLEPCPMCHMEIVTAGVPRAYYCFQDPGMRNAGSRELQYAMTSEIDGRGSLFEQMHLPLCDSGTEALQGQANVTEYLRKNGERFFRPAYEELKSGRAANAENEELRGKLARQVGEPLARDSVRQSTEIGDFERIRLLAEIDDELPAPLPPAAAQEHEGFLRSVRALEAARRRGPLEGLDIDSIIEGAAILHRQRMRQLLGLTVSRDVEAEEDGFFLRLAAKPMDRLRNHLTDEESTAVLETWSDAEIAVVFAQLPEALNRMLLMRALTVGLARLEQLPGSTFFDAGLHWDATARLRELCLKWGWRPLSAVEREALMPRLTRDELVGLRDCVLRGAGGACKFNLALDKGISAPLR